MVYVLMTGNLPIEITFPNVRLEENSRRNQT